MAAEMLTRRMFSLGGAVVARPARPGGMASRNRAFEPSGLSYSQAFLVEAPARMLFVSGQVPVDDDGASPDGFEAQCRLAWANLARRLAAADMALTDLVKVDIFLASRDHRAVNSAIRHEVLGGHSPAITIVVAKIFDESWLLEIDAIACV
jgi:enamine deaminase RidA (YjgF/YER057c/UK114 family)